MLGLTKKCVAAASVLTLALFVYQAGGPAANADELDDIMDAGVIRIGFFEDFPPFSSAGPDLRSHGYDIDVINALAEELGVEAELVGITGQNRIPMLLEHKINMMVSVGYSDERAEVLAFTEPYAPYSIDVVGPKSLEVTGPEDLVGKSLAVNRGTLEDTSLTEVAPEGTDIQRFNDYNGVISAFLSGQVDMMVVGNDVGAAVLAQKPDMEPESKFQLLNSPSAMAINLGEERLLARLEAFIVRIKQDGTLDSISQEWLSIPLPENLQH
ncbi:MAG: transporter substrate-binding domain-containing protein [Pseudomonadota bacterium]